MPLPSSSSTTKEEGRACCSTEAASVISTQKVLSPLTILSDAIRSCRHHSINVNVSEGWGWGRQSVKQGKAGQGGRKQVQRWKAGGAADH